MSLRESSDIHDFFNIVHYCIQYTIAYIQHSNCFKLKAYYLHGYDPYTRAAPSVPSLCWTHLEHLFSHFFSLRVANSHHPLPSLFKPEDTTKRMSKTGCSARTEPSARRIRPQVHPRRSGRTTRSQRTASMAHQSSIHIPY